MGINEYSKYDLLDNPFPQNPTIIIDSQDKRLNGSIFYEGIFEPELKELDTMLRNKTNVIYVRGTQMVRGDGKSAIMAHAFRRYSDDTNYVTAFVRCTDAYGGVNDPEDFCREIIRKLHSKKYLWNAFGRLLVSFASQSSKFNSISNKIELLVEQYPEPPEVFPITLFTRLSRPKELASQFTEWLASETAASHETLERFVSSYMESPKQFAKTLMKKSDKIKEYGAYLKILQKAGYKWGYFFLDQMEESILVTSKRNIGDFSIGFRRLIEEGTNFSTIVCTLHYSSIRTLMDNPTAEINIQGFAPFDKNHFIGIYPDQLMKRQKFAEFILSYILEFRKGKRSNLLDVHPFEPSVIEYIAFLTKGNLRDILRILHNLLKKAVSIELDSINIEFVIQNHSETVGREFSKDEYDSFTNDTNV